MEQTRQPLVDDELYVNEATLEALSNEIESDVKRSLLWSVMVPILAVGFLLILFGVFWLVPREVGVLLKEDPIVNQRFRLATEQYFEDAERGKKVIRDQIKTVVLDDADIQKAIGEVIQTAVSGVNVEEIAQKQIDDVLKTKPVADFVTAFLESTEGQALIKSAIREFFESEEGKDKLGTVTADELKSNEFRNFLIKDLDRLLK